MSDRHTCIALEHIITMRQNKLDFSPVDKSLGAKLFSLQKFFYDIVM